jgi:hypothetical protein
MRRLVLTIAAFLTASPALAQAPVTQRITHEGRSYVYTVRQTTDGQVIDGRGYPGGKAFHLVVRGDSVTGTASGVPVSFRTGSAAGAVTSFQVAAR